MLSSFAATAAAARVARDARFPRWFLLIIAGLIAFVWAVSMLAGIFVPDYEPPASLHSLMLAVSLGLFGFQLIRKNGD